MKKVITILLSAITLAGISVPAFAADINKEKLMSTINEEQMLISTNVSKDEINDLIIKGKNINIGKLSIVINNGKVMVPIKVTAESLGFKVNIDKNNKSVSLDNDQIKTKIEVGVDSYNYESSHAIGMTAPEQLGAVPIVIDNNIYAPIKIYNLLFNDSKAVGSFWSETKDGQSIYVDNGDLTLGWKLINNKWYFMNNNGIMQKGWVETNGNWYYSNDSGEMVSNTITPDGYKVDQSGKWNLEEKVSILETQTAGLESIANPIEEFKTVEEAQKVLKFNVILPKEIPAQFKSKFISTISRESFQICYSNGKNEILFRMGQGVDNISGDYNEYKNNDSIKLDGKSIKLSGNDKLIKLATWKINDMAYSISVTDGMKKDDIINIIKSIF
ncbi:autolysin [Clostridium puniceum]|uniref:Autolysin n=1 Tax=Clostridium puniceum TaxID=29367 RepID=A0A1S8TER0_9CLOT|nr:stalk domain-containing protein [Clostridium puniceum]OOM76198.1 autolysin [Clostridium puniceum]